jgi:hypothetical protein
VSPIRAPNEFLRTSASIIIAACFIFPIFLCFVGGSSAETYVFDGTMTSTMHVVETNTVHVTGLNLAGLPNGSKITFNMTIPSSDSVDGFSQSISGLNIVMSTVPSGVPSGYADMQDRYGNRYRRYTFNLNGYGGSTLDIAATASFDATITGDARKANYTDAIGSPWHPEFTATTPAIQSADPAIVNKKNELLAGAATQAEAVDRIMDFVKTKIPYQASKTPDGSTAVSSLYIDTGTCKNRAYLALGLLRSAGIPSRYVTGMLYDNTLVYDLKGGGKSYTTWGNGLHAWVEVYYPEENVWVPYDPFMDKGFIDTRHVKSGVSADGNIQDRATHGDANLVYTENVNPGINVVVSNSITVSGLNDQSGLSHIYTKSSPSGQTMYARAMQYSPSSVPSATPSATPTAWPNNTTVTPKPTKPPGFTVTPNPVMPDNARYYLTGSIVDHDSGMPVQDATVMLDSIQLSASQSGKFVFLNALSGGMYNLTVSAPGYVTDVRAIAPNGADMDVTIILKASNVSASPSSPWSPLPGPGALFAVAALAAGALLRRKHRP